MSFKLQQSNRDCFQCDNETGPKEKVGDKFEELVSMWHALLSG